MNLCDFMFSGLRILRSGLEHHDPSSAMTALLSTLKKSRQSAKGHQTSSQDAWAEASTTTLALFLPRNLSLWAETTISSFRVMSWVRRAKPPVQVPQQQRDSTLQYHDLGIAQALTL